MGFRRFFFQINNTNNAAKNNSYSRVFKPLGTPRITDANKNDDNQVYFSCQLSAVCIFPRPWPGIYPVGKKRSIRNKTSTGSLFCAFHKICLATTITGWIWTANEKSSADDSIMPKIGTSHWKWYERISNAEKTIDQNWKMYACLLDGIYWTGNFEHLFLKDAERGRSKKAERGRGMRESREKRQWLNKIVEILWIL